MPVAAITFLKGNRARNTLVLATASVLARFGISLWQRL